jgi:DNA-binding XRE family transcriptional regulator
MAITSQQCRAARAWFNWNQNDLAAKSGVSRRAIAEFERELSVPHDRTLKDISRAFEEANIELLFDGSRAVGLRLKQ